MKKRTVKNSRFSLISFVSFFLLFFSIGILISRQLRLPKEVKAVPGTLNITAPTGTVILSSPFTLGGTSVTATGAELNIIHGVTDTTAELNVLHLATGLVTSDLINLAGVTGNIQGMIDSKVAKTGDTMSGALTARGIIRHPEDLIYTYAAAETRYFKLYDVNTSDSDRWLKFKMVSAASSEYSIYVEVYIPTYYKWVGYTTTDARIKVIGGGLRTQTATFKKFHIVNTGSGVFQLWLEADGIIGRTITLQNYPGGEIVSLLSSQITAPASIISSYDISASGEVMAGGDTLITSGNVGIGTTAPAVKLDVVGTVDATLFTGAGTGLTGTAAGLSVGGTAGSISGYNNPTTAATINTIAYRDVSGDLTARLFRTEYPADSGTTGNYFLTTNAVGSGADNYGRPMSIAAVRTALGNYGGWTTGSGYAPLANPAFTGIPTAPTATAGTNTTQLATTAFVIANDDPAKANLTGATFTGTVTAPTFVSSNAGVLNSIYTTSPSGNATLTIQGGNYTHVVYFKDGYNTSAYATLSGGYLNEAALSLNTYSAQNTISNTSTYGASHASIAGSVTATQFNGAGTGLTGTAASLNIGGSAGSVDGIDSIRIIYGTNASGSNDASATQDFTSMPMYKSGFWNTSAASWTPDTGWWWGSTFAHTSNSSAYLYGAQMVFQNSLTPQMYIRGMNGGAIPAAGSWQKVWTSFSDGTGSGLDADMLDGYHYNNLPYVTGTPWTAAGYAPLANPTFTGIPAAPTATAGTNTTQLATTAFVIANDDPAKANLASPIFTGTVTAPNFSGNLNGYGTGSYMMYTGWVASPGYDANTIGENRSGFSYTNNAPWTGPLVHFADGGYGLQLSAAYSGGASMSFRTRNGDNATWNPWYSIIHSGNIGSQSVSYATTAGSTSGNAGSVDSQNFAWSNTSNSPAYVWGTDINGTNYLAARGSMSVNFANSATTLTGLTATYTELNVLHLATGLVTQDLINIAGYNGGSTQLNYLINVTQDIQTQINARAPLASPAFSGLPTAPTAGPGTNSGQLATTSFVIANDDPAKANLASPTFTGIVYAPTFSGALTGHASLDVAKTGDTMSGTLTAPAHNTTGTTYLSMNTNNITAVPNGTSWAIELNPSVRIGYLAGGNLAVNGTLSATSILATHINNIFIGGPPAGGTPDYSAYNDSIVGNPNVHLSSRSGGALYLNTLSGSGNVYILPGGGGNVGIGTSGAGYTLTVNGTSWTTNNAWAGSDIRWKKNIQPIVGALDKVVQLTGVSYNWRSNEFPQNKFDDKVHLGLIAQSVESIVPELVTTGPDGYKGLDYNGFSALLINAIGEQQLQIVSLQSITTDFIGKFKEGLIETKKLMVDGVDILKKLNELSDKSDKQQLTIDSQQKQIDELKKTVEGLKKQTNTTNTTNPTNPTNK